MQRRDITGQRFGRLTVTSLAPSVRGDSCVNARCDCGSEVTLRARSLSSGNTKSCGCFRRDMPSTTKALDLTDSTFGRLTVIGIDRFEKNRSMWSCRCECGTLTVARGTSLTSGNTTSCGCAADDIRYRLMSSEFIGRRFGLIVVAGAVQRPGHNGMWRCLCDCGTKKDLTASDVYCGRRISCGCAAGSKRGLLDPTYRSKSAARCHTRRARKLSAGGTFTAEEISALYLRQRGRCAGPACGCALGDKFHRDHRVPLARGGSNDILNIQLLCETCNLRKGSRDPIDWAQASGRLL